MEPRDTPGGVKFDNILSNFSYPTAAPMEGDEKCAICWDLMSSARRLPCGHMFHK